MRFLGFVFFFHNFSPGYKNLTVFKVEVLVIYSFFTMGYVDQCLNGQPDSSVLPFKNDVEKAE